jgi:hypothetical protein
VTGVTVTGPVVTGLQRWGHERVGTGRQAGAMPLSRVEPVRVDEDAAVVLTIEGELDQISGEALVEAVATAVADGADRLEIDLCSLTGFTEDGACSLVACRHLCEDLADGLHYRTGQGPGRDALLAAYADQ